MSIFLRTLPQITMREFAIFCFTPSVFLYVDTCTLFGDQVKVQGFQEMSEYQCEKHLYHHLGVYVCFVHSVLQTYDYICSRVNV
jgi:hypothetical protein